MLHETEKTYRKLWQGLGEKEQRFVSEYLVDCNAAKAARKAGYSNHCAKEIAYELLTKPHVSAVVEAGLAAIAERCEIDADKLVRELATVAFSNSCNYEIDANGNVVLAEGAPAEAIRAVQAVRRRKRVLEDGSVIIETEFRLWDKIKAIELLGKKLKLWVDKVEVEDPQTELYRLLLEQAKSEQT